MEALFFQPLRNLQLRCPPLTFVIDALDERTSKHELTDLILSLARALLEPDVPVSRILLTSRSEPHISEVLLAQLASRAGRRFIVASTMMKFIIDDENKDPRDGLQLMLKLTSKLLPGTEVYKLYDCILSTCADPKRAYMHLSIVAALADPFPVSQISSLLGPRFGRDVQTTLIQLRSIMDIPTDNTLHVKSINR
jgi:hypothetical protein